MKFQKPLNEIFQNLSHVKVLRVLVNSELDLTGRQIAALAGLSAMGAKKALDHLGELNLLAVRRVGQAYLYRLREDNLIVQRLLRHLFINEKKLLEEELKKVAQHFSGIAHSVYLFGSVSRHEESFESDIDLCIIVRDVDMMDRAQEKALEMTDHLGKVTGVTPTILVLTREDFQGRYQSGDDLAKDIIEKGTILYGTRNLS
jgi:predicted nucleotidyltransferase